MAKSREILRVKRHFRVRKNVNGSAGRPRLCVHRSLGNIHAQIVDDAKGETLAAASSLEKDIRSGKGHKGNVETAKKVGELIGKKAVEKGVDPSKFVYAEGMSVSRVFEEIVGLAGKSAMVMGIGNIGGPGLELVHYFRNRTLLH